MNRLLRILCLWLLALALPLQGAAAARMAGCGTSSQRVPHDHAAMVRGLAAIDPHASHAHGHGKSAGTAHGKCGLCAACCMAAGLIDRAAQTTPVPWRHFGQPALAIGAPEFLTAGPERPPKPFFA